MEIGMVRRIAIDKEMQQAYLDYAMSVIVARALPDARDGLKPVHRRILYAMHEMGLNPGSDHKKSARIVGEVLGKFHPHGDMAVYDAMARMAQDFSMRYPLVDGQGNFGSVDGDSPAAMRYTEARLAAPSMHILGDIHKGTVDFQDNFDSSLIEPVVLPSALPNLLMNGTTGIAVGMSTNIPPHNLNELVDAAQYLLANWQKLDDVSVEDLMNFVKGPDFPTGGVIIHDIVEGGLATAYSTGRGKVTIQARTHLEETSRGRKQIIVTELPFQTNKSTLIEKIASLTREGGLEGLVDLRDESDRQGMRIAIELIKTADPELVLRTLYKRTQMQSTFGIIILALVDGEPRVLSLKQALRVFIEHRLEVIRRKSEHDLKQAQDRLHILKGYQIATKNLDEIITLIRRSADVDTARARMMRKFKLTKIQATAILDMPLRRLTALDQKKINQEYKQLEAQIKSLKELLQSPIKMRKTVGKELLEMKNLYGDRRKTQIVGLAEGEKQISFLTTTDIIPADDVWVGITQDKRICRVIGGKPPRLSGKDAPRWLLHVNTHDTLYMVAENGSTAAIPVHSLPEAGSLAEGDPISAVSPFIGSYHLAGAFSLPPKENQNREMYVVTTSALGMVKKTAIQELPGPSSQLFNLVKINPGDRMGWVQLSTGKDDLLVVTTDGMVIRFSEEEVRPMGLIAAGVLAIKLRDDARVIGMELIPKKGDVFFMMSDGSAKIVDVDQIPKQGRYGQGVIATKLSEGTHLVGMATGKKNTRCMIHFNKLNAKVIRFDAAPVQGRPAQGKPVVKVNRNDAILAINVPWEAPRKE